MILDAGRAFDARRHVDAERPHAGDRVGDVVRRQAAGQQDRAARAAIRPPRPSRSSGRCRRAAPGRARRAAASSAPATPSIAASPAPTAPPSSTGRRHRRRVRRRFVAVQLHGAEPHQARDAVHVVERLIHEHADRRDERRQRRDDRARAVRIDEARAVRPEDEPERAGARPRPPPRASSSRVMPQIFTSIDRVRALGFGTRTFARACVPLCPRAGRPRASCASAAPGSAAVMNRSPIRNAR